MKILNSIIPQSFQSINYTQPISSIFAKVISLITKIAKAVLSALSSMIPSSWKQNTIFTSIYPQSNSSVITNLASKILTIPSTKPSLEGILKTWSKKGPHYKTAAERILGCIQNTETTLNLKNLWLSDLPDIFADPKLAHLTTLEATNNLITKLPESFGSLTHLENIDLSDNHITTLPESFGNLSNLRNLFLDSNKLTQLPESFGNLSNLQELNLTSNMLTKLLESLGNLSNLQKLNLTGNKLTKLPESLSNLTNLTHLVLFYNNLTELSENLGRLSNLQHIDLSYNSLKELPTSLGNLTNLTHLSLFYNNLTELPTSFENLSNLQKLFLTGNPMTHLPEALRALENLEIHDLPFAIDTSSFLKRLCNLAQVPLETFPQLFTNSDPEQKASLEAWLSRLNDTASGKEKNPQFYKTVVHILKLADTEESFRKQFWMIIAEASSTCGDRVTLSILDLDIARQLQTLNLKEPKKAATFLKGLWAYDLLQEFAMNKIASLRKQIDDNPSLTETEKTDHKEAIEEIEIYLGYPIKLKKDLSLPITMDTMLYFACSTITENDLLEAKEHIKDQLNNQEAFIAYLAKHGTWKQVLEKSYPKKFASIQETFLDSESTEADIQTYENCLKDLTKKLLKISQK